MCAEWVTKMETRWREENITRYMEQEGKNIAEPIARLVNKEDCCPGYKRKGQGRGRDKVLLNQSS